jgi:cell wall-associated NlpC family hydrolase
MRKVLPIFMCLLMLVGCQSTGMQKQAKNQSPHILQVKKADYHRLGNEVIIHTRSIAESDLRNVKDESLLDINNIEAIRDYVTYVHPEKKVDRIRVLKGDQEALTVQITDSETKRPQLPVKEARVTNTPVPPPGVKMDKHFTPIAPPNASRQQKLEALRKVGEAKLGVKYIWGHNQERGQAGFDASNYVAYVYHHALGYILPTSGREQYSSVGVTVPVKDMQPGDLVIFKNGGHSGIYMGDGRMLQVGGGTGTCTYLPLKPGSEWYKRISAVKRMF